MTQRKEEAVAAVSIFPRSILPGSFLKLKIEPQASPNTLDLDFFVCFLGEKSRKSSSVAKQFW